MSKREPYDILTFRGAFLKENGLAGEVPGWLRQSWSEPRQFWRRFKQAFDALHPAVGSSVLFRIYDFYQDIVMYNRDSPHPAMTWCNDRGEDRSLSYGELVAMAEEKASHWIGLGVSAGQTLCLVRNFGPEFASDLLAGLKLGVVLSILPPTSHCFLQNRLKQLQPDHISAGATAAKVLGPWQEMLLPPTDASSGEWREATSRFQGYPAGQTVFCLFPAASSHAMEPRPVTSDQAYLSALRDGALLLGMAPGKVIAFPDADLMQTQPAYVLSAFLCGATISMVSRRDEMACEGAVQRAGVHILGVTTAFRDLLLQGGSRYVGKVETWFRCPLESFDMDVWQALAHRPLFAHAHGFNLRHDATFGGCILCSDGLLGAVSSGVFPPPGSHWTLEERPHFQPGRLLLGPLGDCHGALVSSSITVAPMGDVLLCVEGPGRYGRGYPLFEITACIQEALKGTEVYFSLCACPRPDRLGGKYMALLVFVGPDRTEETLEQLKEGIRRVIEHDIGEGFLPDITVYYPFYPRFIKGKIDNRWCLESFLTGRLDVMARRKIYQYFARLRSRVIPQTK